MSMPGKARHVPRSSASPLSPAASSAGKLNCSKELLKGLLVAFSGIIHLGLMSSVEPDRRAGWLIGRAGTKHLCTVAG